MVSEYTRSISRPRTEGDEKSPAIVAPAVSEWVAIHEVVRCGVVRVTGMRLRT